MNYWYGMSFNILKFHVPGLGWTTSVFFNWGSAKPKGSASGIQGFRQWQGSASGVQGFCQWRPRVPQNRIKKRELNDICDH